MAIEASWTVEDLAAIEVAIAQGALEVEYNDRTVRYRSIRELKEARELILRSLGKTKRGGRILTEASKGTC